VEPSRSALHLACAGALALAAGSASPATCQAPPRATQGYVAVNGARLFYEEAGSGPAVVLVHGGFLDRRMWDREFTWLARDYRVVRYDVRGHGRSQADTVAFADFEDLRALLDSLRIARAAVVGLSLGGGIAVDFALAYPDRASALVLVGPGVVGFPYGGRELEAYLEDMQAASANGLDAVHAAFVRWWCVGPRRQRGDVAPEVLAAAEEMVAGSFARRSALEGLRRGLEPSAYGRLREIRVPSLAIVGALDMPTILELVDSLVARVPGARRVQIPGAAHMANMERPAEFEAAVRPFLASSLGLPGSSSRSRGSGPPRT